jgi:voltage-gated potassium channel
MTTYPSSNDDAGPSRPIACDREPDAPGRLSSGWRHRCYELLERGSIGDWGSRLVDSLIILLITISLTAVALESVPAIAAKYHRLFIAIEIIALAAFSLEYGLRLWVAVEHPLYRDLSTRRARLRYALSMPGLIDLIAVLPFWFAWVLPPEFQILLVFRVVRFLKLGRYSPAMRSLLDALYAERRALVGCFVILIGAALVIATLMHLIEGKVQPDKFGTIPDAMWWAIATLGTIGYGDVVPVTPVGRILATGTIFLGLVMVALPVGIVATAFANDIHRREFIVTWGMVARVPLFAELDANQIAGIMRLLQSQRIEAGTIIARRGEPAHSMYFVAAGEVEIDLPERCVRLGAGHFFGEIAVLRKASRSATVRALSRTSLLVLDARDVHILMDQEPKIAQRIQETARRRIEPETIEPAGDLAAEELVASAAEPEQG